MSDSDRDDGTIGWALIGIAIFLISAAFFSAWVISEYQTRESIGAGQAAYEAAGYRDHELLERCRSLPVEEAFNCLREQIGKSREGQRAEHDLHAQQNMARAAWGMIGASLFLGLLTFGVSIYAAILLRQTLDATREVGRDQSRAYLHVDAIELTVGGRVAAKAWIKNSGETPAKWFYLVAAAKLHPMDHTVPFAIEATEDENPGVTWNALGGGDQLSAPVRISEEVAAKIEASLKAPSKQYLLISGFVRYETFFSEIFETEFMFTARPLPKFRTKLSEQQSAALREGVAVYAGGEEPYRMPRAARRLSSYKRITDKEQSGPSRQRAHRAAPSSRSSP